MTYPTKTLILGATGGIGSHLARHLSALGWPLALAARDETKLRLLAEETSSTAIVIKTSSWSEYQDVWEQATSALGSIEGCAHAIGSVLLKPIHMTRESEFDDVISVNLKTAAAVLTAATSARRKHQEQSNLSMVFFSSVAGELGLPNHEAISAAKAGVEGMVRSAAATYARSGIRVNAIAPGLVDTPMTHRLVNNPALRERSDRMHPLGRIGKVSDISPAAAWLLSNSSAWVTGQIIHLDGGMSTIKADPGTP